MSSWRPSTHGALSSPLCCASTFNSRPSTGVRISRPNCSYAGLCDIGADTARKKILEYLSRLRAEATKADDEAKAWASTSDVTKGAGIKTKNTGRVLEELRSGGVIDFAEKEKAQALGRSHNAKLWSAKAKSS